jgi:hypothetical protein
MEATSDFVAVLVRKKERATMVNISSTKLTMHATIKSLVMQLNFSGDLLAITGSTT